MPLATLVVASPPARGADKHEDVGAYAGQTVKTSPACPPQSACDLHEPTGRRRNRVRLATERELPDSRDGPGPN